MRYILYLPSAEDRYAKDGHYYFPHPELSVYKERGAVDGKKEILPYRKNKGYTLLTFRTVEDACYFRLSAKNGGIIR